MHIFPLVEAQVYPSPLEFVDYNFPDYTSSTYIPDNFTLLM